MTTYAIADLHGRHDLLMEALSAIRDRDFDEGKPGGVIVFTGDYVDRGLESRQIVETLMAGPDVFFGEDSGIRYVCLRGNHEEIMIAGCSGALNWWLPNGGGSTLMSYGQRRGDQADVTVVPKEHLDWMARLPVMHVDEHRVFVHAGVQDGIPLDQQDSQENTWMLYRDGSVGGHGARHVVHGHHQHEDGPIIMPGRTNLDTLAWFTGRLVVGVFDDDLPGGPVDTIEIRGKSFKDFVLTWGGAE